MIQPLNKHNITFKGKDDLGFSDIEKIFKSRDEERARLQRELERDTYVQRKPSSRKKRKPKVNPLALSLAAITAAIGIITTPMITKPQTIPQTAAVDTLPDESTLSEEEINKEIEARAEAKRQFLEEQRLEEELRLQEIRQEEILQAVNEIKANDSLKKVFFDLIETKQNMQKTLDNPLALMREILSEPYAEGIELELLLPQIFFESSGNFYNKNGEIKTSSADCKGWMQLSSDAQDDVNKDHFSNNPLDMENPIDNLKLGAAYDKDMIELFDGSLKKGLMAYNAGLDNVKRGWGEDYANDILGYYQMLKNNPAFFEMLINGELDEYQDEFLYY